MSSKILVSCIKKGFLTALLLVVFVSVISFSPGAIQNENQVFALQELESYFPVVHDLLRADSLRSESLEKILAWIELHNRRMPGLSKTAIANEILRMSLKYDNLDVDLICATISHESAFTWQPRITSPVGAMGLMQIMPNTGYFLSEQEGIAWTSAEEILYDPILNIRLGCRYLSFLIDAYHLDGGLAAYNGGEMQAVKWLASGRDNEVLYEETREYVPAILKLYESYRN